MEEKRLNDIISDLEIANHYLYELCKEHCFKGEDLKKFEDAYALVKGAINHLGAEEARMEVYRYSDE